MQLNTVIFDMDGVLIDSEPLWYQAANEVFKRFGVQLTPEQYAGSVGLRTKECITSWFQQFNISDEHAAATEKNIIAVVTEKISSRGMPLPGVAHIFNYFKYNIIFHICPRIIKRLFNRFYCPITFC